jgi:hypothetical protein
MEIDQAKRFLRLYSNGNKLDAGTIRELYLSGYIAIKLHSPEPLPEASGIASN